jgi:hypothetical protein
MKRFPAVITVLLLATAAASQTDEWVKLEPVGAGFSVMMPAKPEEQVKIGDELTSHLFILNTRFAIYLVSYGDYAPSTRIDVDAELVADRDSFARSLSATVVDSKRITKDGHSGLEFTAQNDSTFITSRLYLFGNRIHQISIAVPRGRRDNPNIDRFLASFTFTGASASKP